MSSYFILKSTGQRISAMEATKYNLDEISLIEEHRCAQSEPINFDWQSFRREAAKDILVGIVECSFTEDRWSYEQMAKFAIEQADELIKQLKDGND